VELVQSALRVMSVQ